MSTCPEIESRGIEDLHCLESLICGGDTVRTVYVSDEIWRVVQPPFADDTEGAMHAELRQTLDAFLEGAEFTVAANPFVKPSDAMIARVSPPEKEITDGMMK
jgi:hypothetical protein